MSNETPAGYHRHPNGGGLVADTACVAETAYVGPNASVHDYAEMHNYSVLRGHSVICGIAILRAGVWHESPPQAVLGRGFACWTSYEMVKVGCVELPATELLERLDELCKKDKATEYEREILRGWIETTHPLVKRIKEGADKEASNGKAKELVKE